ncbi:MAG: Mini-ribonuclease 3 [Christensenellales bacterium]
MSLPLIDKPLTAHQAAQMSPLALAYIGDSVHTLYVRTGLSLSTGSKPNQLHTVVSDMVKASAQAGKMQEILPLLSQEEAEIYHRGRNAKVHTIAKSASVADYKQATGFECLIGYLYLVGNSKRIEELLKIGE